MLLRMLSEGAPCIGYWTNPTACSEQDQDPSNETIAVKHKIPPGHLSITNKGHRGDVTCSIPNSLDTCKYYLLKLKRKKICTESSWVSH